MTDRISVDVELACEEDVPEILALANWAAVNTPANFATEPESLDEWTRTWKATRAIYPWLVARASGKLLGFAKGSPHRTRGAYRWIAEVSVYVDVAAHGKRTGSQLYRCLLPTMREQGYVTLLAGITPPNPASERLHGAVGFVRCGTYHRAGWKLGKWHDVGYWELHLRGDEPPAELRTVASVWPSRSGAV
jgi:L-amino acid N-acyltransferase YncA